MAVELEVMVTGKLTMPVPYVFPSRGAGRLSRLAATHLHVDHTSGMRLLPQAEFACSRTEWSAASSGGAVGGYVKGHFPPEARMRLIDLAADGGPVDLLGDGSVQLISTPGHARGHLSVLVRHGDGRRTLVVGDAVYTTRSLQEERPAAICDDESEYLRSLRRIKALAEAEPDVTLVPSHDPDAWRRVVH